jgi:hypothetical protein
MLREAIMVATDEPAGQGLKNASGESSRVGSESAEHALEQRSRALRLTADVACLALLFALWFSDQGHIAPLATLWLASNLAIPWPRIREHVRQHSMATAVVVLIGLWLIADTFLIGSSGEGGGTLYRTRNAFQGLMFVLTGLSNLVAVKAYPERKTTTASLCCGLAAVAAGISWVWLTMHPGGAS